jgi:hypothetical protein
LVFGLREDVRPSRVYPGAVVHSKTAARRRAIGGRFLSYEGLDGNGIGTHGVMASRPQRHRGDFSCLPLSFRHLLGTFFQHPLQSGKKKQTISRFRSILSVSFLFARTSFLCLFIPFFFFLPLSFFLLKAWRNEVLGAKSLSLLGEPMSSVWPELFEEISTMLEWIRQNGQAQYVEDYLLLLERYGTPEEAYFSWSFSPVFDPTDHSVAGIITPVLETTQSVLSDRRFRTLSALGVNTPNAKTQKEVSIRRPILFSSLSFFFSLPLSFSL